METVLARRQPIARRWYQDDGDLMHQTTLTDRFVPFLGRFKRPEYTGENRCSLCTIVNVVIATVATAVLAIISLPLAAVLAVGSLGAIYFRGYLIPGTPELTKRYFPDWLLAWFDHGPESRYSTLDVEAVLREAGVVDDGGADVVLSPAFESAWYARMAHLEDGESDVDELAALLDVEPDRLTVTQYGDAFVARIDGQWVGQWESRAAFISDIAAADVLSIVYSGWFDLPMATRSEVLGALRIFLERCPVCGDRVELSTDVVESCCRSYDVIAATCQGCDSRVFEADFDPDALAAI
jgi:hypothetical protein